MDCEGCGVPIVPFCVVCNGFFAEGAVEEDRQQERLGVAEDLVAVCGGSDQADDSQWSAERRVRGAANRGLDCGGGNWQGSRFGGGRGGVREHVFVDVGVAGDTKHGGGEGTCFDDDTGGDSRHGWGTASTMSSPRSAMTRADVRMESGGRGSRNGGGGRGGGACDILEESKEEGSKLGREPADERRDTVRRGQPQVSYMFWGCQMEGVNGRIVRGTWDEINEYCVRGMKGRGSSWFGKFTDEVADRKFLWDKGFSPGAVEDIGGLPPLPRGGRRF